MKSRMLWICLLVFLVGCKSPAQVDQNRASNTSKTTVKDDRLSSAKPIEVSPTEQPAPTTGPQPPAIEIEVGGGSQVDSRSIDLEKE